MTETIFAGKMPILALRGLCVFPEQTVHFEVGRSKSVKALEAAMQGDQTLLLIPQKDLLVDDPTLKDLYGVGCIAKVKQVLKTQGENLRILVTGISRGKITELSQSEPYLSGIVESASVEEPADTIRARALRREANSLYGVYLELCEHPAQTVQLRMLASESSGFIADSIAQNSGIDFPDKAKMLCQLNSGRRLETAVQLLRREVEMLRLEGDIQEKTRAAIDQNQKDYFLREQMKAIREELGEEDDEDEFDTYAQSIQNLHLEAETEKKLLKDVERLKKQPFGSSEGAVLRNYLDTVLELPWNVKTKERVDVAAARKILEHDHFGLEKVKERILETIAVREMAPQMPPQILCLVGPPGVGKTSISYSIARSLNRKMARISLGGIHDEADIRGHRKTYVGAMPGRIMTAMTQAGSCNPVLLLDEIDKLGSDYRGDPSAALLEVLDAEQNHDYRDHYLEIPFDLSDVLFITTANTLDTVPRPLLDRMEIIRLDGYTEQEKIEIAKRHLIPKVFKENAIKPTELFITDDAVRDVIRYYTSESGVRNLERELATIARKSAKELLLDSEKKAEKGGKSAGRSRNGTVNEKTAADEHITVTPDNLNKYLGIKKFHFGVREEKNLVGVTTGLAWTEVGGDILFIEAVDMPGKGVIKQTGKLGEVMKESIDTAYSVVRSHAQALGINPEVFEKTDVHVHVPEGAIPKDGPSAGITMATSLASALTQRKVKANLAMTGEITLRGKVLPVGGIKEKILAAKRAGIKEIIMSAENKKNIDEIQDLYLKGLTFHYVNDIKEVFAIALTNEKVADAIDLSVKKPSQE